MAIRGARWLMPEPEAEAAGRIVRELNVAPLTARILVRRGYNTPEAADSFLAPPLTALGDPFRMKGMKTAAARLARAVKDRERVLLYGDYDVDGTSSIVILMKALALAGVEAAFHVPHRLRDGYGMRPEVVDQAAADGTRLIVSVDTGIRAAAVVRHAQQLGIDVIVTDHHLPEAEIPPALAVLNPNQPGCEYPEKNLCGAAVALKLAQALFRELEAPAERVNRLTLSFLKMAAIATVADVVPLTNENRVIVRHGLHGLMETPNPGLRALMKVAGFGPGDAPTAGQIAFRVAPRINAAGRMDTAAAVIEMFLTGDSARAEALAAQLHDLNQDRRDTEADLLRAALESCQAAPVDDTQRGLVFAGQDWHRGVVGIVASRLVERFHRPVFVLGVDESRGEAQGSGRSIPSFHLLEALESMPELFTRFGGHRQAAGVTLPAERVEEFRRRFNAFACSKLRPEDLRATHCIDAVAEMQELGPGLLGQLAALAPFGYGNPAPLLAVLGAEVGEPPVLMKEKHFRFRAKQDGRWMGFKAWNWIDRIGEFSVGRMLDLAFTVEEDAYSGWAAHLRDARPAVG